MIRNVQLVSVGTEELVLASDNSGAIGLKEWDQVTVPYDVVGYYSLRVTVMELLAAGASLSSIILYNFCGEQAWGDLVSGIHRGLGELGIGDVAITGSTESNFSLMQSAVGLTVMGRRTSFAKFEALERTSDLQLAVIGVPLVGQEVIDHEDQVAPLALLQQMAAIGGVTILPVGSKGIVEKVCRLFQQSFVANQLTCAVDVEKSAGPSTCFLCACSLEQIHQIRELAGSHYHELHILD